MTPLANAEQVLASYHLWKRSTKKSVTHQRAMHIPGTRPAWCPKNPASVNVHVTDHVNVYEYNIPMKYLICQEGQLFGFCQQVSGLCCFASLPFCAKIVQEV